MAEEEKHVQHHLVSIEGSSSFLLLANQSWDATSKRRKVIALDLHAALLLQSKPVDQKRINSNASWLGFCRGELQENVEGNQADLLEAMGVETDESLDLNLKEFQQLLPKRARGA